MGLLLIPVDAQNSAGEEEAQKGHAGGDCFLLRELGRHSQEGFRETTKSTIKSVTDVVSST